ncbi:hypothetical protein [Litoreibacter roseus]|uniref:Uncharacterized protein n=1 Tax=Litoreibacter roseus TaxID=2601869 RepID=A0A6N6JD60_9RHOB|nr:hypothetical protein [Litoreibacter roseus]GFE63248.1 hypothetical protein KIN_03220 [Litoreibacter roseus]
MTTDTTSPHTSNPQAKVIQNMSKPLGIWVTLVFCALVTLAMTYNLFEAVNSMWGSLEPIVRPSAMIGLSLIVAALHVIWAVFAWKLSKRTTLAAIVTAAVLFSIYGLFALAPQLLFYDPTVSNANFSPRILMIWGIIYAVLIGWSYSLTRKGKLT